MAEKILIIPYQYLITASSFILILIILHVQQNNSLMKQIYPWVCKTLMILLFFCCINLSAKSQTTLAAGDIAFTGYLGFGASASVDQFSFVLLKNITANTVIHFTENGWTTDNVFRTGENTVTWTSNSALSAGQEITIVGTTPSLASGPGTAGTITGTALSFSANGDQVIAYQSAVVGVAPFTFVTAIHMNVYNGSPDCAVTTAAAWDACNLAGSTTNSSAIPTGLTTGVNAIWIGTQGDVNSEKDNARFVCAGDLSSVANIKALIFDQTKWTTSDGDPAGFSLPTNCTYNASTAPSFTTQPVASTLCAGLQATFTAAASGSGITFQWQESTTAGFASPTNINTGGIYSVTSSANNTSLTISDNTTVNGRYYRVVATNTGGSVNSDIVLLTATATTLPSTNLSTTITVGPGNASFAFASACRLLARIVPGTVSGQVDVTSWRETVQPPSYVKRHFEITPQTNPGTSTATVTLYFTQQDFTDFNAVNIVKLPIDATDAANNKANLRIEKRPGVSSDGSGAPQTYTGVPVTITPSSVTWNANASRWEVVISVSGFSGFFAKTTSVAVLPVRVTAFTGKLNADKTATLQWNVAEQQGIQSYVIEESTDGSSYTAIGTVAATNADAYSFNDAQLSTGKNYYRLKIVEQNGRSSYSNIVIVNLKANLTLAVYPNPVTDKLTIQQYGSLQKRTVSISDANGKVLQQVSFNGQQQVVDMSKFPAGVYVVKTDDGEVFKVLKQ